MVSQNREKVFRQVSSFEGEKTALASEGGRIGTGIEKALCSASHWAAARNTSFFSFLFFDSSPSRFHIRHLPLPGTTSHRPPQTNLQHTEAVLSVSLSRSHSSIILGPSVLNCWHHFSHRRLFLLAFCCHWVKMIWTAVLCLFSLGWDGKREKEIKERVAWGLWER